MLHDTALIVGLLSILVWIFWCSAVGIMRGAYLQDSGSLPFRLWMEVYHPKFLRNSVMYGKILVIIMVVAALVILFAPKVSA